MQDQLDERKLNKRKSRKEKYDLSKSFNICGCCGACSRAFVCCVGLEFYISARAEQPIVCYESGEHAPGKKEALLCKIWLHHQTGSIIAIRNPFA